MFGLSVREFRIVVVIILTVIYVATYIYNTRSKK